MFSYSFTPSRRIRAPTEISIPPYTYPHGYVTLVSGARVVSQPNAPVLEVSPSRRASEVQVSVQPVVGR